MEVGKKNYLSYGGFISTEKTRDYQTIATQIPRLHSFVPRNIYISRKLGKMPHEEGDLRYKRQTNTNLPSERTFMWMKENKPCLPRTASTREVLLAQEKMNKWTTPSVLCTWYWLKEKNTDLSEWTSFYLLLTTAPYHSLCSLVD